MALILVFVNKSNLADISDYDVQVLIGDGTPERSTVLKETRIEGHTRADGWETLVRRLVRRCSCSCHRVRNDTCVECCD
jgi:hypothetical protein